MSIIKGTRYIKVIVMITFFSLIFTVGVAMGEVTKPYEQRLPNGVKLIYEYIPNVKVVTVQCWIKTGSVNETEEIGGLSHFLEHILFKGTKSFAPGEIDIYLDSLGGYNNAFTSAEVTSYYVTIPTVNAHAAFKVVSDMVFNALFIEDEINKEKPVVIQEMKRKYDDPSYKMWQDLFVTMFKATPYEREVIGTEKTVSSLSSKKLFDYYNKYYHPENMTLVVVGDIKKDEAVKLAAEYFNQKREVSIGEVYKGGDTVDFKKPVNKVFKADVNLEYMIAAFSTDKKNTEQMYADEVLSEMLSGGEYSLFNEELKDKKGLAVYVTDLPADFEYHGAFGVYAVTNIGGSDKLKTEALKMIADVASGRIDDRRIEKAKNRLKSDNIYKTENVSSLARDIGFSYIITGKEYYLDYVKGINAVSKEDIMNSAKRLTTGPMYYAKTVPDTKAEAKVESKAKAK